MLPEPEEKKSSDWTLLRRIWPYVSVMPGWLLVVAIATPIGVLAQLAQPLLLKRGIDDYISTGDVDGLFVLTMVFVGVVVVGFSVGSLGMFALQKIGLRALARLRRDIFGHVMNQGQAFFDKRTTGSLMTRTTNDVEAVYESLTFGAVGLITDALTIFGTLVAMFWLDWKLTLVAFGFAPIIIIIVNIFRKRLRVLFGAVRKSLSQLNGFFAEQINGMRVVQLYGAQERSRDSFRRMAYTYLDQYRQANWWDAGLYAIMDGMSAFAIGLMLAFGAMRFGAGPETGITLGLLVAFIDYLNKVFVPIRDFSGRFATIQRAVAALDRVFGLLDTHEHVDPGQVSWDEPRGQVAFDAVSFRYAEDRPQVLKNVSFAVKPGEVVALVGATGSGKTTMGKLLLRTYDGYEGSITVDGQELRQVKLGDVRDNVVVVHQDPFLLDATVRENLSLWRRDVGQEAIEAAAQRARAAEFIDQFADGYDHRVAERGGNLSAGQRQLLSIARAMAREAPIVILDEATASVDSITEKLIDGAIEALFAEKTVLVIAHRLSTITKADRILVLHNGRLVEQGDHETLMAQGGRYKLLVESGFAL